jgi:hypothetical protein
MQVEFWCITCNFRTVQEFSNEIQIDELELEQERAHNTINSFNQNDCRMVDIHTRLNVT